MTTTEKDLMRVDDRTQERVIESLVLRGDLSGLAPKDRASYYVQMCEGLGLNPASQPFAYLRLNGKEILYATRGATDQLAKIHRVNREIIDGPKVIDLAGTKLVYAVCRASTPDGRFETATATVPLVDPMNVLMKAETKSKRRATLSILGLGMLDEMELETIPASAQEPGGGVDLAMLEESPDEAEGANEREVPAALAFFYADCEGIELPGESVAVWMKHRFVLAPLSGADREAAWKALCRKTEEVGKMKNAKVWLKKAIAEEDARRGIVSAEPAPSKRILDDVRESAAARHTVRELADLWRSARAEIKDAKADVAGWKIIADRALALGLVPGEVKAEVRRLDTMPPPDGTDGPRAPRSAANDTAGAEGSAAPASGTHGPVALAAPDAWRLSAAGITAHVAEIGNIPRLANSARRNLGAIAEPLRTHAVHVYAGRLQRLSVDGDGSTLAWEACVERAETWLREGPKDAAPQPQRRKDKAA